MSRIGKKEIIIPQNTEVTINNSTISAKSIKAQMSYKVSNLISVEKINNILRLKKTENNQKAQATYGLSRSIINNMIIGVSQGFQKKLFIHGVGYRAQMEGQTLVLNLGYSHPVRLKTPKGITINVDNNTNIVISGYDKEQVGQIAATVRSMRKPEPYKGKGIHYENEIVRRKIGKAGK